MNKVRAVAGRELRAYFNSPIAYVFLLVFTGAGDRAFAAGTDIAQFRDFNTPEHAIQYEVKMDAVLGTLDDNLAVNFLEIFDF